MIAKIKSRTDFSGIVNYANDKEKKSARVIGSNGVLLIDNRSIADSFQSHLRIPDSNGKLHRLGKPVKHISIAFSPKDMEHFPDNEDGDRFMVQLVEEWMSEMGIDPENTQYIIARHLDKEHPHCHLVFNRIANDGSVISDSNERLRNERACRNIKLRHRLTFGKTRSPKINQDRLRKYEASRILIRNLVADSLIQSTDWKSFADNLERNGVKTHLSLDEKTRNIRGIAFEHDGFRISGSKLGHHGAYTYWRMAGKFGQLRENPKIREIPELVRERKTIYIPIVRYVEFVTPVRTVLSKGEGASAVNREYEVGKKRKEWKRIDDHIEEENETYKFKL